MDENEVKALLGIPDDATSLIDRFEREFPGDDFEFVGTLLIRLALARHARDVGTRFICTGLNLEDVLCENMFRLSTGLPPAPVPVRDIGDVTLVLPLWLCPKRIIDGCFPKYSLANYQGRYPCFSLGRNLYYSIVYAMQSQFPGFPEQLAQGLSELAARSPATYVFDEQLGFHVERFVPLGLRTRFLKMVGRASA
jgi:tRNA(Ile)-lysidine synthase TilS/MesJ